MSQAAPLRLVPGGRPDAPRAVKKLPDDVLAIARALAIRHARADHAAEARTNQAEAQNEKTGIA